MACQPLVLRDAGMICSAALTRHPVQLDQAKEQWDKCQDYNKITDKVLRDFWGPPTAPSYGRPE